MCTRIDWGAALALLPSINAPLQIVSLNQKRAIFRDEAQKDIGHPTPKGDRLDASAWKGAFLDEPRERRVNFQPGPIDSFNHAAFSTLPVQRKAYICSIL